MLCDSLRSTVNCSSEALSSASLQNTLANSATSTLQQEKHVVPLDGKPAAVERLLSLMYASDLQEALDKHWSRDRDLLWSALELAHKYKMQPLLQAADRYFAASAVGPPGQLHELLQCMGYASAGELADLLTMLHKLGLERAQDVVVSELCARPADLHWLAMHHQALAVPSDVLLSLLGAVSNRYICVRGQEAAQAAKPSAVRMWSDARKQKDPRVVEGLNRNQKQVLFEGSLWGYQAFEDVLAL